MPYSSIAYYYASTIASTYIPSQGTFKDTLEDLKVENTGFEIGEIRAWRVWMYSEGWLRSITQEYDWPPGRVVEAHKVGIRLGEGLHAFKHRALAVEYVKDWGCALVLGQVALWGDIVEFEKGWHAEFAKIVSLDKGWGLPGWNAIKKLRKTYGLDPHHPAA